MSIYRWIWQHTFHRPWTYVMREAAGRRWWAWLLFLMVYLICTLGPLVVVWVNRYAAIPAIIVGYLINLIYGHAFWDTSGPYIEYQEDFEDEELVVEALRDMEER